MITIEFEYNFGDIVYLKTDPEQLPHIVIGLKAEPSGLLYQIELVGRAFFVHGIQITKERDILKATGVDEKKVS